MPYSLGEGRNFVFQTSYDILFALRDLEWISKNYDPFKATRRLPRVDPPGRGMTIFMG